jgi:hypothetical protein
MFTARKPINKTCISNISIPERYEALSSSRLFEGQEKLR